MKWSLFGRKGVFEQNCVFSPYVGVSECTCTTDSPNLSEGSGLEMDLILWPVSRRALSRHVDYSQ